jgi:hypothetical protein
MGFDNRCGRDTGRRWGTVADAFGERRHSLRYRAGGARNNPPKLASVNYGIAYFSNSIPGDYRYADYKTHVTAALKKSFGNSASTGTKAIKIAADGGRRSADAVLAAQSATQPCAPDRADNNKICLPFRSDLNERSSS